MDEVTITPSENGPYLVSGPVHLTAPDGREIPHPAQFAMIRIKGVLGPTALSAFPTMKPEVEGSDTVLTGSLADRSAVFGVVAQIEVLGLELLELRPIRSRPKSAESGDNPPT